jgi:Nucleoside diphosphate kinase
MEQTYIMIKPDGVQRGLVGEIIKRFEVKGYKLVALKLAGTITSMTTNCILVTHSAIECSGLLIAPVCFVLFSRVVFVQRSAIVTLTNLHIDFVLLHLLSLQCHPASTSKSTTLTCLAVASSLA